MKHKSQLTPDDILTIFAHDQTGDDGPVRAAWIDVFSEAAAALGQVKGEHHYNLKVSEDGEGLVFNYKEGKMVAAFYKEKKLVIGASGVEKDRQTGKLFIYDPIQKRIESTEGYALASTALLNYTIQYWRKVNAKK